MASDAKIQNDITVSYYKNVYEKDGGVSVSLYEILKGIRNGEWEKDVQAIQSLGGDKHAINEYKQTMRCFTAAGVFSSRKSSALSSHSSMLVLDFDDVPVDTVKKACIEISTTFSAFVSPSGNGVKVIVRLDGDVPNDNAEHVSAWRAVSEYYAGAVGHKLDESGKDSSRLCFVSYDPDVYINPDCDAFIWRNTGGPPRVISVPDVVLPPEYLGSEPLDDEPKKRTKSERFEIDTPDKVWAALSVLDPNMEYPEWTNVCAALQEWESNNRYGKGVQFFDSWSRNSHKYIEGEPEKKFYTFEQDGGVKINTLFWMADNIDKSWRERYTKTYAGRENAAVSGSTVEPDDPNEYAPYPKPSSEHTNPAYWAARLIWEIGERCVIAVPSDEDVQDGKLEYGIYRIDDNGRLDRGLGVTACRMSAAQQYWNDCGKLDIHPREAVRILTHARDMYDGAKNAEKIRQAVGEAKEKYPSAFISSKTVKKEDIDMSMDVISGENGVFNIDTGEKLSLEEAREKLVSAKMQDRINVKSTHELVDLILPPWTSGSTTEEMSDEERKDRQSIRAWQIAIAWSFRKLPHREFFAAIGAAGAGKTTRLEALSRAMHPYVGKISHTAWEEPTFKSGTHTYNTDFEVLGTPYRLAYTEEAVKKINKSNLKDYSGGSDKFAFRDIRERRELRNLTASIFFIGNSSGQQDSVSFGLGGDDEDSRAMRDRAKMLPVIQIPEEIRNPNAVHCGDPKVFGVVESQLQRESVIARVMEYIRESKMSTLGDLSIMESLEQLQEARKAQIAREKSNWETEWLPYVIVEDPDRMVYNSDIYSNFMDWFEENKSEGEIKPAMRTITDAVAKMVGVPSSEWQKIKIRDKDTGGRKGVSILRGWALAEEDDNEGDDE